MDKNIVVLKYNKKTKLVCAFDINGKNITDLEPEDFIITDGAGFIKKLVELKYNPKLKGYQFT